MITHHLPDFPPFEYTALVPWPWASTEQLDWIDAYTQINTWLVSSVGPHWARWGWHTLPHQTPRDCCVSFRYSPDRTLFLLRWG